jgi:ABC-2 type transport system ATP-binding protein
MSIALRVSAAEKRYATSQALAGAGVELAVGEWLALLGPNGAGKTTLIRAIAGRVRLDAGEIELLGRRLVAGERAGREALGIVPQEIALYAEMTPVENLELFGYLFGVPSGELRERVRWALAWTGLEERGRDRVGSFSGGMRRRLNIACGVLHRPRVVLLDEPTVGVDPQSRERIWEMLAALKRDGASLLLTTHQLDEAERVCDRIAIIDRGRSIAAGTLEELVSQTVGAARRVRLTVAGAAGRCETIDVAAELPERLLALRGAGRRVEDVRIEAPSLQAVFLHLTGRELRE